MQLTQPDIRPIGESGQLYRLHEAYPFLFCGAQFNVPEGFTHDGATFSKLLFQRDGVHRAACLVHDYLYEKQGYIDTFTGGFVYTRYQADQKFKEMLKAYGVKKLHVFAAYWAVRLFGGFYWRGN